MAKLSTDLVEAHQQTLEAIKSTLETIPKVGLVHIDEQYVEDQEDYYTELLKYEDSDRGIEVMSGILVHSEGPTAGNSGTTNYLCPEVSFEIEMIKQFECSDEFNSTREFNNAMMRFYSAFESKASLGLSGLSIYAPEIKTKAAVIPYDGFFVHYVSWELRCTLFAK